MLPIINHPDYVAQIGDDHKFPIKKFGELFKLLKEDEIIKENNLHIPGPVSDADLARVHTLDYINKIKNLGRKSSKLYIICEKTLNLSKNF